MKLRGESPFWWSVGWLAYAFALTGCSDEGLAPSGEATVTITEGWQWRAGDSPRDEMGRFAWLDEGDRSGAWEDIDKTVRGVNPLEPTYQWMRLTLPSGNWRTPAIHFASLFTAAELYLDGNRIARLGKFEAARDREYTQSYWNVVALPRDASGNTLYLRVFSYDHVGVGVSPNRMWFGDYDTLIRRAVHHQLDQFVLGAALFLVGFITLVLWTKRRDPLYGSFGLFMTATGAFLTLINTASRYFLDFMPLRVYCGYLAFLVIPLALFLYYQNVTDHYRDIARKFWKFHLYYAATSVAFDLVGLFPLQPMAGFAQALLPFELGVLLVLNVRSAKRGDGASKVFNVGFAALGVTGIHDLLVAIGWLPDWRHLIAWGVFCFVAVLGYLVERRFHENVRALEESNLTLEHRVAERTRDLNEKNEALETALERLRATQQQLVVQEKMASLGNLVAGIAHEINTPVGAVASSADTSARSLKKIERLIEESGGDNGVAARSEFQTAIGVLSDNQKVIGNASQRIDTIVRGLRNFARLDESEFMDADLHEGIDSSLALIRHELTGRIEVVRNYGELPSIRCYPSRLNQVFMNLLVNATQAIDVSGTIEIRTGRESENVFVEVRDDGRGIAAEDLERVFDPGFTTKGVGVGTGLGLSISYQIVRDHGGRIEARSQAGDGTVFKVTLPVDR